MQITQAASAAPALITDQLPIGRAGALVPQKLTLAEVLALAPRRNPVMNGAMEIDQRNSGAAIALPPAGVTIYAVDRHAVFGSSTPGTVQRRDCSAYATGFRRAMVLQRDVGSAATAALTITGILETFDSVPLAGKQICLSWWARGGANYSAPNAYMRCILQTGTGVDQSASQLPFGLAGGVNQIDDAAIAIPVGGAMQRFYRTCTIPANCTQIGWHFQNSAPTGVAGADDSLWVTGVQIDVGTTVPGPFDARPYAIELEMVRRYYERLAYDVTNLVVAPGRASSATAAQCVLRLAKKRVAPTFTSSAASGFLFQSPAGNVALTNLAASNINTETLQLDVTVAGGLTAGHAGQLTNTNPGAFLAFDAEL